METAIKGVREDQWKLKSRNVYTICSTSVDVPALTLGLGDRYILCVGMNKTRKLQWLK